MTLMRLARSRSVCVFMVTGYRAYNRPNSRPTDNTHDHAHALNMEERKDDELFMLGCITGLCNQEPRDQLLLDDMLLFLREAQEARNTH